MGELADRSRSVSVLCIEWIKTMLDVRTPAARDIASYWVALALMAGTLAFVYLILRSRRSLALGAIRDHAAAGLGTCFLLQWPRCAL